MNVSRHEDSRDLVHKEVWFGEGVGSRGLGAWPGGEGGATRQGLEHDGAPRPTTTDLKGREVVHGISLYKESSLKTVMGLFI